MSIATDSALNFARGVLELDKIIETQQRTVIALGTENDGLKERIDSVNKQLMHLKGMMRASRGMRYEDYNPIMAHLDHTIAILPTTQAR